MKKYLMIATLVISANNFAGELNKTFKKMADNAGVGNGDAYVEEFNPKEFSYKKVIKKLKADRDSDNECKTTIKVGRRNAFKVMKSLYDNDIAKELKKLYKQKKIKAALVESWDGDSGDSEYCLIDTVYIYGVDGDLLIIDYDRTT